MFIQFKKHSRKKLQLLNKSACLNVWSPNAEALGSQQSNLLLNSFKTDALIVNNKNKWISWVTTEWDTVTDLQH